MATYGANVLTGGTASASTDRGGTTYAAHHAVDADENTRWATDDGAIPGWWRYDFGVGVTKTVQKFGMILKSGEITNAFWFQGSADGTTWRTIHYGNGANNQNWQYFAFDNATAYRYYRIWGLSIFAGQVVSISEIEMYERTDALGPGLVPLMPASVVVSSDRGGGYEVGKSWDENPLTRWATPDGTTSATWRADLGSGNAAVLASFWFVNRDVSIPKNFVVAGSNNDSTWTDLLTTVSTNIQTYQSFAVTNSTAYRYYRMSVADVWGGSVVSMTEVLLWGEAGGAPPAAATSFRAVVII